MNYILISILILWLISWRSCKYMLAAIISDIEEDDSAAEDVIFETLFGIHAPSTYFFFITPLTLLFCMLYQVQIKTKNPSIKKFANLNALLGFIITALLVTYKLSTT